MLRARITVAQQKEHFADVLRSLGIARRQGRGAPQLSIGLTGTPHAIPDVVRRLVQEGADIESVVPEEPPLEDVYLRLLHPEGAVQ